MSNLTGRMPTRGIKNPIPTIVEVVDTDPLLGYRISDRDTGGAFNYYGYMKKDAQFYIMREDTSTGAYRYYKGTVGDYVTDWTNRANLTYAYLNLVFT